MRKRSLAHRPASSPPHALADLDDHITVVVGITCNQRVLELVFEHGDAFLGIGQELTKLLVFGGRLDVGSRLTPGLRELVGRLELFQPPARGCCLAVIVEDRRVRHTLLRRDIGALELLDQCFEFRHQSRILRGRRRAGLLRP